MPQPTATDVHVNTPLTNISIAFMQSADVFVASRAAPIVPVQKQSDLFYTYNRDDWFRLEARQRAPGTESAGGGWELATSSYRCNVWAIHKDVDDQVRSNADSVINLDRDSTEWVTRQLLLRAEVEYVDVAFNASSWTGTGTGNDQAGVNAGPGADQFLQWDDVASTPIEDIRAQITAMEQKTGFRPNKIVMGPEVWDALVDHPDLLDRIKYTEKGIVGMDLLAALLGIDEVMVPHGVRDTAAESATSSFSFLFGKSLFLCYTAAAPSLMHPTAIYQFGWVGFTGTGGVEGIGTGSRMKKFHIDALEADRIEGEMAVDVVQIAADLGALFVTAVA